MRKKFQWDWEPIAWITDQHEIELQTLRSKVFGGWIIETIVYHKKYGLSSSSVFIKDSDHEWIITKHQEKVAEPEKKLNASEYAPLPTIT